jgi:hypothetical protein
LNFQDDPDSGIDSTGQKSHKKRKRDERLEPQKPSKRSRLQTESPIGETSVKSEVCEEEQKSKKEKKDKKSKRKNQEEEGELVSYIEFEEHKIELDEAQNREEERKSKKEKKDKKSKRNKPEEEEGELMSYIEFEEHKIEVEPADEAQFREEERKSKKDKKGKRNKPEEEGELASNIEFEEYKMEVDEAGKGGEEERKKKKKRKDAGREFDNFEPREMIVGFPDNRMEDTSPKPEEKKKKHKKDKKTDLLMIKPDPDGQTVNVDDIVKNTYTDASANPGVITKQEFSPSKQKSSGKKFHRQLLIENLWPIKSKKSTDPVALSDVTIQEGKFQSKKKSSQDINETLLLEAAPSFMVATSTPTSKADENVGVMASKDSLINDMMAKFRKKSKKSKETQA